MVLDVIPIEVIFTPVPSVRDIIEAAWLIRLILSRLELVLAKWIVMAHPRAAMTPHHIQVTQQVQIP